MDPGHPLARAPSLMLAPGGHGHGYAVAIYDRAGTPLATCDADGTVRDASGTVLLAAPVRRHGRRDQPLRYEIQVADGHGRPLGTGGVASYGVGPRARKATVAVSDASGAEVARLEPRDKKGAQLALTGGGAELAAVRVDEVKRGFLRRDRVYSVDISEATPPALRPLVLAVLVRYDALLSEVVAASNRDR